MFKLVVLSALVASAACSVLHAEQPLVYAKAAPIAYSTEYINTPALATASSYQSRTDIISKPVVTSFAHYAPVHAVAAAPALSFETFLNEIPRPVHVEAPVHIEHVEEHRPVRIEEPRPIEAPRPVEPIEQPRPEQPRPIEAPAYDDDSVSVEASVRNNEPQQPQQRFNQEQLHANAYEQFQQQQQMLLQQQQNQNELFRQAQLYAQQNQQIAEPQQPQPQQKKLPEVRFSEAELRAAPIINSFETFHPAAYAAVPVTGTAITKNVHYAHKDVVTGYNAQIFKPDLRGLEQFQARHLVEPARQRLSITPTINKVEPEVTIRRQQYNIPVPTPVVNEIEFRTPVFKAVPAPISYSAPIVKSHTTVIKSEIPALRSAYLRASAPLAYTAHVDSPIAYSTNDWKVEQKW